MFISLLVKLALLSLYVGGSLFLSRYVRQHLPTLREQYFSPLKGILYLWLQWWGPTLTPVLALLWWGKLPWPLGLLLISIVLPSSIYVLFSLWVGVFKFSLLIKLLLTLLIIGADLLVTGGYLFAARILVSSPPPLSRILTFLYMMILPSLLHILFIEIWAPSLVPLSPAERRKMWREAVSHFLGFFTGYPKPSQIVVDGEVETRIPGNPFYGYGPGLLITEPENIAIIKGSANIIGPKGPGVIYLGNGQMAETIMNLREQLRVGRVKARTRDGIYVDLPIASIFKIDPGERTPALGEPWPYRKSAAFKAAFAVEVDPAGKTPLDAHQAGKWDDLPLQFAKRRLKQVVEKWSLDELYGTKGVPKGLPRAELSREVREFVVKEMAPKGIKVTGGAVGNKIVPVDPEIIKQRVEVWRTKWIRKIMEETNAVAKELAVLTQRVRRSVWSRVFQGLFKETEAMSKAPEAASTLTMMYLLNALEEISRDPRVEPLLPEATLTTLKRLRIDLETEISASPWMSQEITTTVGGGGK